MITPTARRILECFAAAFPASAHYRGGRRLRRAGWSEVMPEIVHDVEAKQRFLHAVDELCGAGIVSVKWRRFREGDEVEALYLERPEDLYRLLERRSPAEVATAMRRVLQESGAGPPDSLAAVVAGHIDALLEASHPLPFSDEIELRDALVLLALTPQQTAAVPLRALSVRLFSDSKRIETLLRPLDAATRAAAGLRASDLLGLSRSYPEATIALCGTLQFGDGRSWRLNGETITLPPATINALEALRFNGALLTVENKESFAVAARALAAGGADYAALLYSGGHPNRAVQLLLSASAGTAESVRHFGDMDPEGLLIYQEIAAAAPQLRPHLMDVSTYRRYLDYGRPLSRTETAVLNRVTRPELAELVAEMRLRRIAVEQEVVDG